MHSRFSFIIGAIGRTLIGLGLLVLAFATFQLWGTGLLEARAQDTLEADFAARQAAVAQLGAAPPTSVSSSEAPGTTTPPDDAPSTTATLPVVLAPELAAELLPEPGQSLGFIRIPSIGLERVLIEGVGRNDLRKGPGHYSNTPLPGQAGNAAIAGHRTTYGQPFYDLDKLEPGELIEVETLQGTFFYEVMGHLDDSGIERGHFIVEPTRLDIVEDAGDNRLTLTACHPKRSARQRIVVTALMVGAPAPTITAGVDDDTPDENALDSGSTDSGSTDNGSTDNGSTDSGDTDSDTIVEDESAESLNESLGWHTENLPPTLLWGALAAMVLLAGWLLGRAWHRWPAYALTAPVFLVVLFIAFVHLDRTLPAF